MIRIRSGDGGPRLTRGDGGPRLRSAALALAATFAASCAEDKGGDVEAAVDALNRVAFFPADAFVAGPDEAAREVRLERAFVIDRFEVTNAEYAAFMAETGTKGEGVGFLRHWKGGAPPAGLEDHPVVWVSRADAEAFAAWRGMRLPAPLEWERAARGNAGYRYPWGNPPAPLHANTIELGLFSTTRVGTFESGRTPSFCYDLAGNVLEWTSEPSGLVKGGSYWRDEAWAKAYFELAVHPGIRWEDVGFRCAADAEGYLGRVLPKASAANAAARSSLRRLAARWGPESAPVLRALTASAGIPRRIALEMAEAAENPAR